MIIISIESPTPLKYEKCQQICNLDERLQRGEIYPPANLIRGKLSLYVYMNMVHCNNLEENAHT